MTTTTKNRTVQQALTQGSLNDVAEALRKVGGRRHAIIKAVVTGLTAAAAIDITTADVKAAATITGIDALDTGENLPAIGQVLSLRVTAVTTATVGTRTVSDVGETPSAPAAAGTPGLATISDDGKTLTFEGTVTGFTIQYTPRSETAMTTLFAPAS